MSDDDDYYDWWSKYYHSLGVKDKVQKGYDETQLTKLIIYKQELEKTYNKLVINYIPDFNIIIAKIPEEGHVHVHLIKLLCLLV